LIDEEIHFSASEWKLFEIRHENGYNLYDERYNEWLRVAHPENAFGK